MAREDFRDTLAKQPPSKKVALLLALLLALGGVYWIALYRPLADQVAEEESRLDDLERRNDTLVRRAEQYDELLAEREALEDNLRASLVALPVAAELPAFFVHLQRQIAAAGVSLEQWQRLDEEDVSDYKKVPVEMEISGTYHEIMEYFQRVYETDRVITIEDLRLETLELDDDELELSAAFTAATFRQTGDGVLAELETLDGGADADGPRPDEGAE